MSVKLIPVRNSVREEKRKKGDGEWDFFFLLVVVLFWASQVALVVKNLPTNAGDIRDLSLIPGLERSPGGGHGNPLHYSCLENPMDRGAWWAAFHRVAKSLT